MSEEFVKKYNLVQPSAALLNAPLPKFDFNNPPVDPVELASDLLKHMRYYRGIGLSANQLGLPYRVFAMEGEPGFVCFNPTITANGDEEVMLDEGCLSYPGLYMKIKRPQSIRVRFQDPYGNVCIKKFSGMTSRVFQHEYEHMEGQHFVDNVSRLVYNRAKEKQQKLLRKLRQEQLRQVNGR